MDRLTPLRKELIEWAGYKYLHDKNIWNREHSVVNLRHYPEDDKWYAYHGPDHFLCQVTSLGHLTQLIIAIEGDVWPIIFNFPKV